MLGLAPEEALRRLRAEGLIVFGAGERAVEAVAALVRYHEGRRIAPQRRALPALPAVDASGADGVQPTVEATEPARGRWRADGTSRTCTR